MGQHLSWQQPEAKQYATFLVKLFGRPQYGSGKAGGALVWVAFTGRQLFQKPVCFSRVMIKDERVYQVQPSPHYTYLTLSVSVPASVISDATRCALPKLYSGLLYDTQSGMLTVRTNSLERGITLLRLATDAILGKQEIGAMIAQNAVGTACAKLASDGIKAAASQYYNLCANLAALATALQKSPAPPRAPVQAQPPTLSDLNSITAAENFENPYTGYTSNSPYELAAEQERDDIFYSESHPFLGGANREPSPAYASEIPNYNSIEHLKIHPKCKGECAKRAHKQFEKDKKRQEGLQARPSGSYEGRATYNVLSVPASAGVSAFTRASEHMAQREHMSQPNGSYQGRATYSVMNVPASAGVSAFTRASEHLSSEPDPRFFTGAGDLYYMVGSDINTISRTYGTVDQKRVFPKYTDAVVYGITAVPKQPTNYLERRKLQKAKPSPNFKPTIENTFGVSSKEHFVSTGSEHVKFALAEEGTGADPFLYWTEGK